MQGRGITGALCKGKACEVEAIGRHSGIDQ
jgi:hypothetical protein